MLRLWSNWKLSTKNSVLGSIESFPIMFWFASWDFVAYEYDWCCRPCAHRYKQHEDLERLECTDNRAPGVSLTGTRMSKVNLKLEDSPPVPPNKETKKQKWDETAGANRANRQTTWINNSQFKIAKVVALLSILLRTRWWNNANLMFDPHGHSFVGLC